MRDKELFNSCMSKTDALAIIILKNTTCSSWKALKDKERYHDSTSHAWNNRLRMHVLYANQWPTSISEMREEGKLLFATCINMYVWNTYEKLRSCLYKCITNREYMENELKFHPWPSCTLCIILRGPLTSDRKVFSELHESSGDSLYISLSNNSSISGHLFAFTKEPSCQNFGS